MLYSWLFDVKYLLNNSTFGILAFDFLTSVGYVRRRIKLRNVEQDNKFKVGRNVRNCWNLFINNRLLDAER